MLKLILASQHTNFEVNSFITTHVSIVKKKKMLKLVKGHLSTIFILAVSRRLETQEIRYQNLINFPSYKKRKEKNKIHIPLERKPFEIHFSLLHGF